MQTGLVGRGKMASPRNPSPSSPQGPRGPFAAHGKAGEVWGGVGASKISGQLNILVFSLILWEAGGSLMISESDQGDYFFVFSLGTMEKDVLNHSTGN